MTKWLGPAPIKCDICQAPITDEFFDARTQGNRWGNFCKVCFNKHTDKRLGVGFGQHYKKMAEGWVKQVDRIRIVKIEEHKA